MTEYKLKRSDFVKEFEKTTGLKAIRNTIHKIETGKHFTHEFYTNTYVEYLEKYLEDRLVVIALQQEELENLEQNFCDAMEKKNEKF